MILLDTCYLIRALIPGTEEAEKVLSWCRRGEDLCTSGICWYEFLSGPIDGDGEATIRTLLDDCILPFTADQAAESARLYNAAGRKRQVRVDCMIAAAAIICNAGLATGNRENFTEFGALGLMLAD